MKYFVSGTKTNGKSTTYEYIGCFKKEDIPKVFELGTENDYVSFNITKDLISAICPSNEANPF